MLGINKAVTGIITHTRSLLNHKGIEVEITKGEKVVLTSCHDINGNRYFGILKKSKSVVYLPPSLFNNSFKLFQQGV